MADRADTGARERLDALLDDAWEELLGAAVSEWYVMPSVDDFQAFGRLRAALAAGVGVPPDARVVSALQEIASFAGAPCSFDLCNRPTTLAECVDMLTCHVCCAVAIAKEALAGVGEARPAEPAQTYPADDLPAFGTQLRFAKETIKDWVGAPAEEQPDARARAERTLAVFDGVKAPWNEAQLARDVVALTEELQSRETENQRLREQLDAARQTLMDISTYHFWEIADARRAARAALGVVAAAEQTTDLVSAPHTNREDARGDKEAL